jgi:hypothetical protein
MPRTPRTPLTPEEQAVRRTRVNSYQARIERSLTDIYMDVPTERQAGQAWHLVAVAHTQGHATCELCGHNPIRRLFFIRHTSTNQELMIGSECARNYARVDLIDAYLNRMVRQQNTTRQQAQRAERQRAFEERRTAQQAARSGERQGWATTNADVIAFLATQASGSDNFLRSLHSQVQSSGWLTERQTDAARRNMARVAAAAAPAAPTQDDTAGPDDAATIFNGVYTIDMGGRHLTFKIHTVLSGPLQGKRIVKRQLQYGEFQGFGFLNRQGGLSLWRRFDADADSTYVQWARQLLTLLAADEVRSSFATGSSAMVVTPEGLIDGHEGTIRLSLSRSCRRCNRALTTPTSIAHGIGPECERRVAGENETVVADARATAPRSPRTAVRRAARPVFRPATATSTQGALALSEIVPEEVQ